MVRTVKLDDAPGYVVPVAFKATYDDPAFPCLVTLVVRMRSTESPVVTINLHPRLNQYDLDLWAEDGRTSQFELSPYEHMGRIPEIPTPRLLREALMQVAMPEDQPFVTRSGSSTGDMPDLPEKNAPRSSLREWKVIRLAYKAALEDPALTKRYEVLEEVFERVHEAFPDQWPRGDGATPDYYRLRRYLDQIDHERD